MAPASPVVVYIWPDATPPTRVRDAIGAIAGRVPHLGTSMSPVAIRLCPDPPAPDYVPDEAGDRPLGWVGPGRLAQLEQAYRRGEHPLPGRQHMYALARPAAQATPSSVLGEWFGFVLVSPTRGLSLDLRDTLALTTAVRRALLGLANPAPAVLHGHQGSRHAAIIPLADVGHDHADGHLMGMSVLVPGEVSADERQQLLRALARLHTVAIAGAEWGLEEIPRDARGSRLRARTWSGPASRWVSVTPVAFDRFPKPGRLIEVLGRSCGYVGLPVPVQGEATGHSALGGVPPSLDFPSLRRRSDPRRYLAHVALRFAEPVRGPIVLGALRHFGLGLLYPLADGDAG